MNKARRKMQRSNHPSLREIYKRNFAETKKKYKDAIDLAKTTSWKNVCSQDKNQLCGSPFKAIRNKPQQLIINTIQNSSGGLTSSIDDTAKVILDYFFKDTTSSNIPLATTTSDSNCQSQPVIFTENEIAEV